MVKSKNLLANSLDGSYIVTWYLNVAKIGERELDVAICEKTGSVCFVSITDTTGSELQAITVLIN